MADYGLLSTGFVPEPLAIIRQAISDSLRSKFGASLDVGDGSPLGHLIGILAERLSALWELAEQVYNSQNADSAAGDALRALGELTGTFAPEPTASRVLLTLTGTYLTSIAAGSRAKMATGERFATESVATIGGADGWASGMDYIVDDVVKNSGRIYRCTVAGTSGSNPGPTATTSAVTDGSVTWKYLGAGTGYVEGVYARAVDAAGSPLLGPTIAAAGDINIIDTPVSGWSNVVNELDAVLGQGVYSDESFRVLREIELFQPGTSTNEAIRAALFKVTGVTAANVFSNSTNTTNGDGMPPHSVECMVTGGTDVALAEAIFKAVAGGIATYGNTSETAVDSEGTSHTIYFTRPTARNVYVTVDVVYDANFPADGVDQIKAAIVAAGVDYITGQDVVSSRVGNAVFTVAGTYDVSPPKIGFSASPTLTATLAIGTRERAAFDTTRIVVNASALGGA